MAQCGHRRCGNLLQLAAIDIDGGRAVGALQYIQCDVVPLVVAQVGGADVVGRSFGLQFQCAALGDAQVDAIVAHREDGGIVGLSLVGTHPQLHCIVLCDVGSDL